MAGAYCRIIPVTSPQGPQREFSVNRTGIARQRCAASRFGMAWRRSTEAAVALSAQDAAAVARYDTCGQTPDSNAPSGPHRPSDPHPHNRGGTRRSPEAPIPSPAQHIRRRAPWEAFLFAFSPAPKRMLQPLHSQGYPSASQPRSFLILYKLPASRISNDFVSPPGLNHCLTSGSDFPLQRCGPVLRSFVPRVMRAGRRTRGDGRSRCPTL